MLQEEDDEAGSSSESVPDDEGDISEADENLETFARLKAGILQEEGMVELDASPVVHDHSLTWSTLHGPGRFEKVWAVCMCTLDPILSALACF